MRIGTFTLGTICIAWTVLAIPDGMALERKIYKCIDANGVAVFAEKPCGNDAKEIGSLGPSTVGTGASSRSALPRSTAIRDIGDSADDSSCRRDAEHLAVVQSSAHLDDLIRRKHNVESDAGYLNNNLAGAIVEEGIRKQVGDMEIAIEQERARISIAEMQAQATSHDALMECDRKKAIRDSQRSSEDKADAEAEKAAAQARAAAAAEKDGTPPS